MTRPQTARFFTRRTGTRKPKSSPRLQLEQLEVRFALSGFHSFDGTGHNLLHPEWGSIGSQLVRVAPAAYGDGVSTPSGDDRPGARTLSNAFGSETEIVLNDRFLSDFIYVFGQMVDHDLDLTISAKPSQPFNIPVPAGDPVFDPLATGTQVISLNRSKFDPATGDGAGNPRQQINEVTAWLDGSVIYGSTETRALALRTLEGGRLKTSVGNLLPLNTLGLANQTPFGDDPTRFFVAGDVRVNENIELTSIQTVWMREHNRLAGIIQEANPTLDDEAIFQRARRLVVAEFQHVTYNEFLPALLGRNALRPYTGYRPEVNPGIANEFSTVGFRVGHTFLGDDVEFLDNNGEEIREELPLSEAFFNPGVVQETGIEPILKYLATDKAREGDTVLVNSVRNFLFDPPSPGVNGFDLFALDVQRARDHGLPDYNSMRAAYGLRRVASFAQITSDVILQQKLLDLYGDVNNIDAFVGGLAEDHVRGSSVGPLFHRIIADQFERLRDGDRFWYENNLSRAELREVRGTTLSDLIRRNTTINNIQDNAFFFEVTVRGQVFADFDGDGSRDRFERGLLGFTVTLLNDEGTVIATTLTRRDGSYAFVGLVDAPGKFRVEVLASSDWRLTSPNPVEIHVTRGEVFRGLDFGVYPLLGRGRGLGARGDSSAGSQSALGARSDDRLADEFFARLGLTLNELERPSLGGRKR